MNNIGFIFGPVFLAVLGLYLFAMLLRFLLQLVRADFYNPISQFLVKITNPLVLPLRRVIPGYGGIDLSSLLLAFLLQIFGVSLLVLIQGDPLPNVAVLAAASVIGLMGLFLNLFFFAIIAMIVLSWIAPGSRNPAVLLLYQITEPVMAPFRKLLPSMGGLDLSPILVIIVIGILERSLIVAAAAMNVQKFTLWL